MSSSRFASQVDLTFGHIEALISSLSAPPSYHCLLLTELRVARREAASVSVFPAVELPLALASSIAVPQCVIIPVVAATTIVYLGADVLDNIMDAEVPPEWGTWSRAQVLLAATTMLSPLWARAVDRIPVEAIPPNARETIRELMVQGLLDMSLGQFLDLDTAADPGRDAGPTVSDLEAIRRTAELKSGKELGMFAAVVAATVSADHRFIRTAERIGMLYGSAGQIASDLTDLFDPRGSRDLAAGTYTLPLAHARRRGGATRLEFDRVLTAARAGEAGSQDRIQELLVGCGSVQYCALVINSYRRSANQLAIQLAKERGGTADAVVALFEPLASIGSGATGTLARALP